MPGEPVALHVSTYAPTVQIEVARDGAERETVWRGEADGAFYPTPDDASSHGCGWPAALEIPVGADWRSGYYAVTVTAGDQRADAFLVVRSAPERRARADPDGPQHHHLERLQRLGRAVALHGRHPGLVRAADGAGVPREARAASAQVAARARPRGAVVLRVGASRSASRSGAAGPGGGTGSGRSFRWAEANGFRVDVAISQDLEAHPELLDGRRMLLSRRPRRVLVVGHARDGRARSPPPAGTPRSSAGTRATGRSGSRTTAGTWSGYKYGADEDPVLGTPDERFADERLGRPPDRLARVLDDRALVLPRRVLALRARRARRRAAPTRSGGPTTGRSRAPTSRTATPSASRTRSSRTRSTGAS